MIKVLIADDHAIVREGLKQILADTLELEVTDEAGNAQEILEKVRTRDFNVLVLDISFPDGNGLEILKRIKSEKPELPVLILSIHSEDQYAIRSLKAGASGYLMKDEAPEVLAKAIDMVSHGRKYITPSLAEKLACELETDVNRSAHEALSDREFDVLCKIGSGKTVKKIADEMKLSIKTISTYRTRILQKLNLNNSAELTHYVLKNKLLE